MAGPDHRANPGCRSAAWLFFSIFLHHIALAWGIATTSGTHAALILGLNPLLTTILASYFIKESFTWLKALAIFLGFSGVSLIISGQSAVSTATLSGDITILVATLAAAVGSLFIKKSTSLLSPLLVTAYSHVLASAGLVLTAWLTVPVWIYDGAFTAIPVAVILFSSLINTALGALWWNTGIQQVGRFHNFPLSERHPRGRHVCLGFFPQRGIGLATFCRFITGSVGSQPGNRSVIARAAVNVALRSRSTR